jgi:D-glycero-alpha-D-manno-heptose-7-phosphate kinase
MIISRTPLRISVGGGGSDLPSYYRENGGFFISAAIDKHVYIGINRTFAHDYILRYSSQERVKSPMEIAHPIIREVLGAHNIGPVEIVSLADVPAGTGLGSSGSFTVGLLRAIYGYKRETVTVSMLAEEACSIEIEKLKEPVGKQDQYIAAFGGITCFEIDRDGAVKAYPLALPNAALHDLEDHLLLFFSGYARSASAILRDQQIKSDLKDKDMRSNLGSIVELGLEIKSVLSKGDTLAFADLMHEHWLHKRARSPGMSNQNIDLWYDTARANGARGGKIVGAGGGGFLLLYCTDPAGVRRTMAELGLEEIRFKFDFDGSIILHRH